MRTNYMNVDIEFEIVAFIVCDDVQHMHLLFSFRFLTSTFQVFELSVRFF